LAAAEFEQRPGDGGRRECGEEIVDEIPMQQLGVRGPDVLVPGVPDVSLIRYGCHVRSHW
jgi:hypothetical protein